jgi:hypothetical protein
MLYNNLLFFLVVIFVISTTNPTAQPVLAPLWTLAALAAVLWGYGQVAARTFARAGGGPNAYFRRKSGCRSWRCWSSWGWCICWISNIISCPCPWAAVCRCWPTAPVWAAFSFVMLMWRAGRPRYQQLFQRRYTTPAFLRSNVKANLPIVLPWLILSLVFDGLRLLSFPG